MLSSLRISSRRASTPASAYVITRPCSDIHSPQLKHMLVYGVRRWFGTFLGKFNCQINKLFDLLIGRLQLAFVHPSGVKQQLTCKLHRVFLLPLLNFVAGSIICTGIAFVVTNVAIGLAFDKSRATIVTSTADGCLSSFVNRQDILAID